MRGLQKDGVEAGNQLEIEAHVYKEKQVVVELIVLKGHAPMGKGEARQMEDKGRNGHAQN